MYSRPLSREAEETTCPGPSEPLVCQAPAAPMSTPQGVLASQATQGNSYAAQQVAAQNQTSAPSATQSPATQNTQQPASPVNAPGITSPHERIPVRELSREQAQQELEALQRQGAIAYRPNPDEPGNVHVQFPVNGVNFHGHGGHDGPDDPPDRESQSIDPRMAVGTYRTSQWAHTQGVNRIDHDNYRAGGPHRGGQAWDISGFRGVDANGQPFNHNVSRDWGRPARARRDAAEATDNPDRTWGHRYSLNRNDPDPQRRAHAEFFQGAYNHMTSQYRDQTESNGRPVRATPTRIGDGGFVISPDHPSRPLARRHDNHFHVEVPHVDPPRR